MKKLFIMCLLSVCLVGCSGIEEGPQKLDMDQYNRYDEEAVKKEDKERERDNEKKGIF